MIYTGAYLSPETDHGLLIPISRSVPSQYKALDQKYPLQSLLAPSADLLRWWKRQEKRHKEMGWKFPSNEAIAQYTSQYLGEIDSNKDEISQYLWQVDTAKDETWLCWEPRKHFCHRNIAYEVAVGIRPDCAGGQDIEVAKPIEITIPSCSFRVGDLVGLPNTNQTGIVLEITPEKEGSFPQALGIESYTKIQLRNAIAWWKTIQLRKV